MPDWVHAAERAYVAAGTGGATVSSATVSSATPDHQARAIAAAGAIASHYLAVGSPRSFGIIIASADTAAAAALSLAAHRAWFDPRDIRCASTDGDAADLASLTGGRLVSLGEALACDIVNVYAPALRISAAQLRRGTHVNALSLDAFDLELRSLAIAIREAALPGVAAGLVDGRKLDELTLFAADGAPIALSVV